MVFKLSTSASTEISLSAMVSAAWSYWVAVDSSPDCWASDAISNACRAFRLSFSSSPSFVFRRISACFWLAITLTA